MSYDPTSITEDFIFPTSRGEVIKFNFEVLDNHTIAIHNWQWWDTDGLAGRIHKWLNEYTVLGADACCVGQHIRFEKPEELTLFVLYWSGQ